MSQNHNPIFRVVDPIVRIIDEKSRTLWHKITSEVRDRMGDIIRIDGIDTSNFQKKPAVIYGHKYADMDPVPIIGANEGFRREGKDLYAITRFLNPKEVSQRLGELVHDLWVLNQKRLMGWSVGFIPLEWTDIRERGRITGYDYTKSELLEYSNVIIPANQDAINDAIKRGLVSPITKDLLASGLGRRDGRTLAALLEKVVSGAQRPGPPARDVQEAARIVGEAMGKFYWTEVPEAEVPAEKKGAVRRAFDKSRDLLREHDRKQADLIGGMGIRWVKETAFTDSGAVAEDHPFLGMAELDSRVILVRADVPTYRLERVVAHEIYHLWFSLKHGYPQGPDEVGIWEAAADNFSWKVSAALFDEGVR